MTIFADAQVSYLEWDQPSSDIPIRQGDLLVKKQAGATNIKDAVIVITADCDIAREKYDSAIAALPLISFPDYVRHRWANERYDATVNTDHIELTNQFNKIKAESLENYQALKPEVLAKWIERENPKNICHDINDDKSRERAEKIIAKIQVLLGLDNNPHIAAAFDRLLAYECIKENKDQAASREALLKKARGSLSTLPADLFFLSTIPIEGAGVHLVLLRELAAIKPDLVTTSATTARLNNGYLRIGRLKPAFKYALSQQFGLMFSRVGLPDDYENSKKTYLKSFDL